VWVTGTYDPAANQTLWGTGNPVPMFDPFYRPGDNLYTNSVISYDPDTGNMNWYFNSRRATWGLRRGRHPYPDRRTGRRAIAQADYAFRAQRFLYTMERANGAMVLAKPYMEVNWTKGIDQKTGKPLDYDPAKDIQTYAGTGNLNPNEPPKTVCPSL